MWHTSKGLSCMSHTLSFQRHTKCKQKCTQLQKPFYGTIFRGFSYGVIHIDSSVIEPVEGSCSWLAVEDFQPMRKSILDLAGSTNNKDHTMGKRMKNCDRKWYKKVWTLLFVVNINFGEMCKNPCLKKLCLNCTVFRLSTNNAYH